MPGFEISSVPVSATHRIQRYGEYRFRIADVDHEGSVVVFPDTAYTLDTGDDGTDTETVVTMEHLGPVIRRANEVEILILGCGETFLPPPKDLRGNLKEHEIVLEWMDTGAACRTYNVLLGEGRQVAAVLIAVP